MNFLIYTGDAKTIARPDSTRNKDNGDYFVPEDVNTVGYVPVVFVRFCRTGKMIGSEFTERYYDAVGFGILLYPSADSGEKVHFCRATGAIYDKTSLLPLPMYNPVTLENGENVFSIETDGRQLFSCNTMGMRSLIRKAIANCSSHTTIHKGDIAIAELGGILPVRRRGEGDCHIRASFCSNEIIDIDLKF